MQQTCTMSCTCNVPAVGRVADTVPVLHVALRMWFACDALFATVDQIAFAYMGRTHNYYSTCNDHLQQHLSQPGGSQAWSEPCSLLPLLRCRRCARRWSQRRSRRRRTTHSAAAGTAPPGAPGSRSRTRSRPSTAPWRSALLPRHAFKLARARAKWKAHMVAPSNHATEVQPAL